MCKVFGLYGFRVRRVWGLGFVRCRGFGAGMKLLTKAFEQKDSPIASS